MSNEMRPRIILPDLTNKTLTRRENHSKSYREIGKVYKKKRHQSSKSSCTSPSSDNQSRNCSEKHWDSSNSEISTESKDRFERSRVHQGPKNNTTAAIRNDKTFRRKRATQIGWNTSDDESPKKRREKNEKYDRCHKVSKMLPRPQSLSVNSKSLTYEQRQHSKTNDIFAGFDLTPDAAQETMRLRKRAFVLGKFRFIIASGNNCGEELESSIEFQRAIRNTCENGISYVARPPGYQGRLPILSGSRYAKLNSHKMVQRNKHTGKYKKQYSKSDQSPSMLELSEDGECGYFPGSGKRHHVAWSTPLGDVRVDAMVKLYDLLSIQIHHVECDNRGPKSSWFGLVDPRLTDTNDGRVHFDANMFWTVGLLLKHFGTCGVEAWDKEMAEMAQTHICAEEASRRQGQVAHFNARYKSDGPHIQSSLNDQPNAVINPSTNLVEINTKTPSHIAYESVNGDRYTGCVVEWRGTYGYISCMRLPSKVFLKSNEVQSLSGNWQPGRELPLGTSVNFGLLYDQVEGYKALNAKLYI